MAVVHFGIGSLWSFFLNHVLRHDILFEEEIYADLNCIFKFLQHSAYSLNRELLHNILGLNKFPTALRTNFYRYLLINWFSLVRHFYAVLWLDRGWVPPQLHKDLCSSTGKLWVVWLTAFGFVGDTWNYGIVHYLIVNNANHSHLAVFKLLATKEIYICILICL